LHEAADAEAGAIRSDARLAADRLLDAARTRANRHREAVLADRRSDLAREREGQLDAARADASRLMLAARERFVSRVFRRGIERAPHGLSGPDGAAWLTSTVRDALEYLPPGGVILHTPDPRATAIASQVDAARAWSVRPLRDASGVIVESDDGIVRVDATFERFIRAERPRLAQALVARIGEPS
jgi:vacuolar-type H+-ATPase subunit E/Vma4